MPHIRSVHGIETHDVLDQLLFASNRIFSRCLPFIQPSSIFEEQPFDILFEDRQSPRFQLNSEHLCLLVLLKTGPSSCSGEYVYSLPMGHADGVVPLWCGCCPAIYALPICST